MMNRLLILLIYASAALSHQESSQRIDAINQALNQSPVNHELYLSRGDLFRQNSRFEAAEQDFQQAIQLGASPLAFAYHQSQSLRQQNRNDEAKAMLVKALKQLPDHHHEHELLSMAHLSLAEMYANQQAEQQAAHHIKQVIATSSTVAPGLYLQAVDWVIAAHPKEFKDAYRLLNQGLATHPGHLCLHKKALAIEIKTMPIKAIMHRLLLMMNHQPKLHQRPQLLAQLHCDTRPTQQPQKIK